MLPAVVNPLFNKQSSAAVTSVSPARNTEEFDDSENELKAVRWESDSLYEPQLRTFEV